MKPPHEIVQVSLAERSYPIVIGSGLLDAASDLLCDVLPGLSHAVMITDNSVGALYGDRLQAALRCPHGRVDRLEIPPGEKSKSIEQADRLWQEMLRLGADRRSVVVALGGGVVGDVAGFVAATFARGVALVQVPTSLLAQVDSSVGGKVGINLPEAKNMVGAFWQPAAVVIDTEVLGTLADRQYRAGLAEVVKYGVILDAEFFEFLERHVEQIARRDAPTLTRMIRRCCELKARVVAEDEREESGCREVLNYGHTFGHALEAAAAYDGLLHGEAVAVGMTCASRLARRLGRIGRGFTARQARLLAALGLPTSLPCVDRERLLALMRHDKKSAAGRLRFVLPDRLGHAELVGGVSDEDVLAALDDGNEDVH
jgi:3-dehydroquinate synthase